MVNEVWITFKKGIPTDVYMSKETAEANKFHSEKVEHFIHVENGRKENDAAATREQQLIRANALLQAQIGDLTTQLEKSEKRMTILEKLLGVPVLMRHRKSA
jgi:regulatory protein YycH of two-component signal transduction system YycFG